MRQLSLLFGVSAFAVSAVLTVFMGGLGLGSFLAGRFIDRHPSPLKAYAVIELGIGIYAFFIPLGIDLITPAYLLLPPAIRENFALISLSRFLFAFLLLIIPTSLMGATFPVISRVFTRKEDTIGKDVGVLYSLNTLGAVFGCLLAGFYLLETLGVLRSLYLAAGINLILALSAFLLSTWGRPEALWLESSGQKKREKPVEKGKGPQTMDGPLLFLFGLSGFVALALEVFWTRLFIFLVDNTVYAFATILCTFLLGIAIGSMCFSRVNLVQKSLRTTFGKIQAGIGIGVLLTLFLFGEHDSLASFWNQISFKILGGSMEVFWTGKVLASFLFIFSLLIIPTFLMGAAFPVVFKLCSPEFVSAGRSLGLIYSVNTIGAILGSFFSGFVILPLIGIQNGMILVSIATFLSGFYLLVASGKYATALMGFAAPFVFLLALQIYSGDVSKKISFGKLDPGNEILFYKEGVTGTVLVSSMENDLTPYRKPIKRIWINGDPIAGSFREALQLEWLQAHIPLLLHPNPQNTVVICFGTGSTAGAISEHPVKEIIAVDTERGAFEAAPHFKEGNRNISAEPRFRAVIEDGRQFLATTNKKFDFITSEPPPPSNAGIVNLYTREYYEICKSTLKPGGMISQWIPLHHLSVEDFRSLVATFVSAFPHSTMWFTKWDAIMIGSNQKLSVTFAALKQRMEGKKLKKSLAEIGFENPYRLLSTFMMGEKGLQGYMKGAEIVTDDHPTVEFTAPRVHHIGISIKGENLKALLPFREPVNPFITKLEGMEKGEFERHLSLFESSQRHFYRGKLYKNDKNLAKAVKEFRKAIELEPSFTNAKFAYLKIHMDLAYYFLKNQRPMAGLRAVGDSMKMDVAGAFRPQLLNLRGLLRLSKKEFQMAASDFMEAMALDKDFPGPYMNLATLFGEYMNDPDKAIHYFKQCLKLKITEAERKVVEEEIGKLEGKEN